MNVSLGDLYASLTPDEVGVVLCCILPADDPMPRYPEWKRAAKTLGMGLSTIYRVRNALISRGVLVDHGTHFGLDEAQIVPRGPIAKLAAAAMERGVLSPSVGKISYKGFPTQEPQSSNSGNGNGGEVPPQELESVNRGNPPGPPNGKAHAGANSFVRSSLSEGETNERTEGGYRGEEPGDIPVVWTAKMLDAIPAWIGRLFKGTVPDDELADLGREFKAEAMAFDRDCFRTSAKYVAWLMATTPEKVKTVFGLTKTLAERWERDGVIPRYATAAVEKFEASRKAKAGVRSPKTPVCYIPWGPGHPNYRDTTPGPRIAPETMSA